METRVLKQVLLFKPMLMYGEVCRVKLGFLKIFCNWKATKPGCSLLHFSHLCKRNSKFYRAFLSHFVHMAGTWTACGGQQRTGQNIFRSIFILNYSSPDLILSSLHTPVSPATDKCMKIPQISPININLSFCPSAYTLFSLFQGFLQHLQLQMDAIQNIFMIFCKLRDASKNRGRGRNLRS